MVRSCQLCVSNELAQVPNPAYYDSKRSTEASAMASKRWLCRKGIPQKKCVRCHQLQPKRLFSKHAWSTQTPRCRACATRKHCTQCRELKPRRLFSTRGWSKTTCCKACAKHAPSSGSWPHRTSCSTRWRTRVAATRERANVASSLLHVQSCTDTGA